MGTLVGLSFCLAGVASQEVFRAELATDRFTYTGIEVWSENQLLSVINTDDFVDDYSTIVLEYYNKYVVTLDETLGWYWDALRSGTKLFV